MAPTPSTLKVRFSVYLTVVDVKERGSPSMSTVSRRSRPTPPDPHLWRLIIVVVSIIIVLSFGTLNCWLFLHYGQQQVLVQALVAFGTLVSGLLGGAGLRGIWFKLND